jgi:hypothetical protein
MKTILAAAALTLVSSSAFAEDGYTLNQRRSIVPEDVEEETPVVVEKTARGLSDKQVDVAIETDHSDELEYCWLRVPPALRKATDANIHLSIETDGVVSGLQLTGDLPDGVASCISDVASRWTFPVATAKSEIDHALRLSSI